MIMSEGIEMQDPETENPEAVIEQLRGECAAMGRNDREFPEFDAILDGFRNAQFTAAEAIQKARQVRDSKQDY